MRGLLRPSQPMRGTSSEWLLLSGVSTNITFLISDLSPAAWPRSRLTHLFKIVRADKFLSQVSSL